MGSSSRCISIKALAGLMGKTPQQHRDCNAGTDSKLLGDRDEGVMVLGFDSSEGLL